MATDKQNTLASLYKASLKNQSAKQSQVEKNRAYIQSEIAKGPTTKAGSPVKNPPPKNFLEGVLNFLEGPMQGMYKATGLSNLTDPEYAKRVAKDPVGTLLQSAGETLLIPGRMLYETGRSWFDPNFEKTYGSEIIEGAADAINYGQGRDTYNETDTVNPWVKGIGGFALDVASDPLTYVPGALIAKPFTKAAQVTRTALGLPAKGVSATTGRTLAQAAQDAAGIIPETATAVRDTALAAEKAAGKAATEAPVVSRAAEDVAAQADDLKTEIQKAADSGASDAEITTTISKASEDARQSITEAIAKAPTLGQKFLPELKQSQKFVAKFSKELDKAKTAAEKVKVINPIADLATKSMDYQGRKIGALTPIEFVKETGRGVRVGGIDYPPQTIIKGLKNGTLAPRVKQIVVSNYNKFVQEYKTAYKEGSVLTPQGERIPLESIAVAKADTPAKISALDVFRKRMDEDAKFTDTAIKALGPALMKEISGKMSNKRFEGLLQDIGQAFDGVDLDTLRSMGSLAPGAQEYLLSKNITDADLIANYNRLKAEIAGVDPELAVKAGEDINLTTRQVLQDSGIKPEELINAIDDSFKYVTDVKQTAKTGELLYQGRAVQKHQMNQYPQTTLLTKIIKSLSPNGKLYGAPKLRKNGSISASKELYGPQRMAAMKAETMPRMAVVEDFLDESGIPTFFFYGEHLAPIRMGQAMEAVMKAGGTAAERAFFNHATLIPPTNFAEAVAYISSVAGKELDLDELRRILQNTTTPNGKKNAIDNMFNPNILPDNARVLQHYVKKPSATLPKGQKLVKNASGGWWRVIDPESLTDQFIDSLVRARPALDELISASKAKYAERLTVETSVLTDDEIQIIMDAFETGGSAALLEKLSTSAKDVTKKAKAVGAMNTSADAANKLVKAAVDEPIAEQAERVVPAVEKSKKAEKKYRLASSEKQIDEATKPLREESQKMAKETLDEYMPDKDLPRVDTEDPIYDIASASTKVGAAYETSLFKKMYFTLAKNFNARFGINSGWEMQHGASGLMSHVNLEFNKMFNDYARKFRTPLSANPNVNIADEAMRLVQAGKTPAAGMNPVDAARLAEAMPEAQKIWDLIFMTDGEGLMASDYFKSGGGVEGINSALARFGAGSKTNKLGTSLDLAEEKGIFQFDTDIAVDTAALSQRSVYDELVDQVRGWDLGDRPLDTLRTVQAAMAQAMMHANVSDQLQAYAVKMGVYSKTPVKGWFKPTSSKKTMLLRGLDTEGYYPPEFLEEVGVLNDFLQQSRTLDGPFGQFIHKTLDPVLDAWKFGMTIIRPGHHIRNAIGDASITYAAEGVKNSRVASVDATRLLAYKNSRESKYEVVDYLAMLNRLEPKATANGADTIATISLKNGKKQKLTVSEVRNIMDQKGLFPSFGVSEDLLGEGQGIFSKVARAVSLQNRFTEKVGGNVSQYRDHWARAQHFMQFIRNNADKYTNIDDLYEAASKQVKKYHPDGSMLSSFEAKYMRRGIPFYSWMRGILPGAIEATIAHPGRFMMAPKASFNLAVAMGVDPESLSDPFPTDQMFPSFIREDALGPQFFLGGDYIRMNPGVATLDLASTFSGGIGKGIISSMNPMFKLPFELNNMTRLDTGAKIHDVSDYIDSQIPNIGPLSNITGVSPTGTLASLFSGQPGLDPQYQVAKGNKDEKDRLIAFTNWLTGMGVQNLSQENLVNYAEIEARNEALKQKQAQQGGQ